MSDFPSAITSPRTIANRPGVVFDPDDTKTLFAEDIQNINAEIVAIETTLGTNPEGGFDTVGERIADLENNPSFVGASTAKIKRSSVYAFANAGFNKVLVNQQELLHGSDLQVDTANNRIKVLTAGTYLLVGQVNFADNVNGSARGVFFYQNGSQVPGGFLGQDHAGRYYGQYTQVVECAVNDYIYLHAYQDSGGNLNINSANLSVIRVF